MQEDFFEEMEVLCSDDDAEDIAEFIKEYVYNDSEIE